MIERKELSQNSSGLGRLIIEIVSVTTEADVYSVVARNLPDVLPAHRATVVLRAEASDLLRVIALRGDDGCMPLGVLLSSRKTVVGQVIESGLSRIWVPDPQSPKIDESQLARQGMRSIMNVPIRVGQKVIGSINVASRDWDAYGVIEQHILLQVASLLGSCIDRIRLATGMDILSRTDALTGLANRSALQQYLQDSLAGKGAAIGLLFIDLDDFKYVNDFNGQWVGDVLLKCVAGRLRTECNRQGLTLGRIGADEFAVVVNGCDLDRATELAELFRDRLAAPYQIDGGASLRVGASIGIAVAPMHGEASEALFSHADMALCHAKTFGAQTCQVFTPDIEADMHKRRRLEVGLRDALAGKRELFIFYQPIVDIQTERVTARECLIRWYHAEDGWISPGEFIPFAEEVGLIGELGLFVLNRACQDAATWTDGARVAVNVSPLQLGQEGLSPAIWSALLASGLPAERLEIEVTESALLHDDGNCLADLRDIQDLGVRVALDDFGTGFSSLSYLKAFPFDKIKIDASFVRDAVTQPDCAAIVRTVADLGKRLGVVTVAEGVETQAQLKCVTEAGCTEVQGFLFGHPEPRTSDAPIVAALGKEIVPFREPDASRSTPTKVVCAQSGDEGMDFGHNLDSEVEFIGEDDRKRTVSRFEDDEAGSVSQAARLAT